MKSVVFIAVISAVLVSVLGGPVTQLLWVPNSEGTAVVPAILGEDFSFDAETDANPNNIHFFLWTRNPNQTKKQEIENTTASLDASFWDKDAPVKVFAHGFTGTSSISPSTDIKNAYIKGDYPTNVNVVLVDWGWLAAAPWYDVAALGTKTAGRKTAHLLDFLVRNGYTTLDKIHLNGHSLGAHVAGFAGAEYQKLSGGPKIPRVTGLDAALPRFGDSTDENRLDPSDGDWVDVMHTNAGILLGGNLGFREPRGHYDVYPNKGSSQPGCGGALELIAICSHNRAPTLYVESINSRAFKSIRCNDDNYKGKQQFTTCDASKGEAIMGEWAQPGLQGIHYLETKKSSPFALP